jgi:competence protein ComEC
VLALAAGLAGVLAGSGWQLQQPVLWPAGLVAGLWALGLAVLAVGLVPVWRRPRPGGNPLAAHPLAGAMVWMLAATLLSAAATHHRAAARLAQLLPPHLEGQDLVLVGTVADLPRHSLQGTRFLLQVEQAWWQGQPVALPPRVSLGWFRGWDGSALHLAADEPLRAGQRWQLPVRLKQPHGNQNPHGFDLELWMFERGLRASGHVRAVAGARAEAPAPTLVQEAAAHPLQRARQALRDAIFDRVADPRAAAVLAALAVGDQGAIDRDGWELFRVTGVTHLMSISGLHVTMFAWLAGGLISVLWRRWPAGAQAWPTPLAAAWGGLALALAYAVLAGWGVPAQRTVWMLATVVVLRTTGLRWPLPLVLLLVAAVVVAADPWALLQPGFWLSFVAVALLVLSEPVTRRMPVPAGAGPRLWSAVQAGLRTQAVATVGLAPLTLLFFQQVSLVGFVANAVAIPLVTLAIVPLALAGVLLPLLWVPAGWLVQGLTWALQALAAAPWALWLAAAAPPWALAAGLLGGALAVLPLPWRLRLLAVPLLLPLLWPALPRPAHGQFETVAVDVGQGGAVLVRTRAHLLVYDAGPRWSPESEAGSRVLLPLLRARGERRIDLLMLSHAHLDHIGGADALLAGLPVRALSSSLPPAHPLSSGAVPHARCEAGQRWAWDGVQFEVLWPTAEAYAAGSGPNALSCVVRVAGSGAAGGRSLLLTGDLERAQESAVVRTHGAALASEVMMVPHHGSRTSSTPDFLAAVAPRWAVAQMGYRNRFGHPVPEVRARYQRYGIDLVRSDRCGAWTLPPAGPPHCQRDLSRRYWHHPSVQDD